MSCEKRINIEQKVNFHFKSSLTINASVQKIEYFTLLKVATFNFKEDDFSLCSKFGGGCVCLLFTQKRSIKDGWDCVAA